MNTSSYKFTAAQSEKISVLGWMFIIFILSLPFRDFYIVHALSADNILVPILSVLWLVVPRAGIKSKSSSYIRNVLLIIMLYFFGALFHQRVFHGGSELFQSAWNLARNGGYFILPLLFINNKKILKYSNASIIIITSIGCITALLVSLGLLNIERARIDEARLGIDILNKATGVFTNFGDLALLLSYSILLLIIYKKNELPFRLSTKPGKIVFIFFTFAGLLGTQSRNILLSILVGLFSYWGVSRFYKLTAKNRQLALFGLLASAIIMFVITVSFSQSIIDFLINLGGGDAANTANARLSTYIMALGLIDQSIAFGISYTSPIYQALAEHIHNIWLGLLLRGGIFALIGVAWIIIIVIKRATSILNRDSKNKQARVVLSFVFSMLISTLFFPAGSLIFWFILGLACASTSGSESKIRTIHHNP